MNTFFRTHFLELVAALASVILTLQPADVDAQTQGIRPSRSASSYVAQKERMNAWTVGLAGGQLEGPEHQP